MKKHLTIGPLAAAVAGLFGAGGALAYGQIPLTLEEARAAAEADRVQSIRVGAEIETDHGASTAGAKSWNGYGSRRGGADVDLSLSGGDEAEGWSLRGDNLGTPVPHVKADYEKAGSFALEGEVRRMRHLTAENAALAAGPADLETVRDVYRIAGRWLPSHNTEVRAAYQMDVRDGTGAVLKRGTGNNVYANDIDDAHHQAQAEFEYLGSGWRFATAYELSKFENDATPKLFFTTDADTGEVKVSGARALDPSNTFQQVKADASFNVSKATRLSVAAGYAWSRLDDDVINSTTGAVSGGTKVEARVPSFSAGIVSTPLPQLRVELDYSFRRYDKTAEVSGGVYTTDQDYSENKLDGSAVLALGSGWSAKAYGRYRHRSEDQVVESVQTYAGGVELRKRLSAALSGSLGLEVSGQTARDWIDAQGVSREATPWDRLGYSQSALKLNLTSSVTDALSVSLLGSAYVRSYEDPENPTVSYAMTKSHGATAGVDVDWAPSRDWNLFGFYAFDRMTAEIDANGAVLRDAMTSHTFGAGLGLHPAAAPWSFALKYVYGIDRDDNAAREQFDWRSQYVSHYAEANLSWRLSKSWQLEGAALYGKVDSDDLRRKGSGAPSGAEFTSGLYAAPDYTAGAFYIGAVYYLP